MTYSQTECENKGHPHRMSILELERYSYQMKIVYPNVKSIYTQVDKYMSTQMKSILKLEE